MADTSNRGLGSDNMDPEEKRRIQSEGGKASHSGGQTKGGQSSQSSGNDDRGFAAMKKEGREDEIQEIASKGGKAAHDEETAHEWTSEEASKAGKIGGSD